MHGIYLRDDLRDLGRTYLATASLNSVTLLGAEVVGRAYGGGLLKLEPGEARLLPVPRPELVRGVADRLESSKADVATCLARGRLLDAVDLVDGVLLAGGAGMDADDLVVLRAGRAAMIARRRAKALGVGA